MDAFRRLLTVVLISGATAGLLLSALQFAVVVPLIRTAETYEHEEHATEGEAGHGSHEWQPSDGLERTLYTVVGTVLTGIAFSAVLLGVAALLELELDARRGLWLGLAGFACFALAPGLGLPPAPPGAAAVELHAAQVWWIGTALATAVGLWAIARSHGAWLWRVAGIMCLSAPHLLGAPHANGASAVPAELSRHFALVVVATQGVFWLLLGVLGSHLLARRAWRG